MATGAKKIVDRAMGREKLLSMAGGFEPAHLTFPLASRLMRKFSLIVESLVLAMFNTWNDFLAGRFRVCSGYV